MLSLDTMLFKFINSDLANGFFDFVIPIFSDEQSLLYMMLVFLIVIAWKGNREERFAILAAAVAVAIVDPTCSKIIKPLVGRIRPCFVLDNVRILKIIGGQLSLPSNHCANVAAIAGAFGFLSKRTLYILMPAALLVGFSRIYVGNHYPLDVLAGWAIGGAFGALSAFIVKKTFIDRKTKKGLQNIQATT